MDTHTLKLFAFIPRGCSGLAFYTIAANETDAIKAVNQFLESATKEDRFDADGWGTDYYLTEIAQVGEVIATPYG